MSDIDSIVCVDENGNPIDETSEKWPLHAVYEIDDSDSSVEMVQFIAMVGREEDVLADKKDEEKDDDGQGKNDAAESLISLTGSLSAEDPDRPMQVTSTHNDDTASSCLVDRLIIETPSGSSTSSDNSVGGDVDEDMSDVVHHEVEEASKDKEEHPIKHKADETTKLPSLPIRSRVYAKWTNGQYFWGTITARSGDDYYSVLFDDGDYLHQVPKNHLETAAYMKKALGETPPPLQKQHTKRIEELISRSESTTTLEGMLNNKCGKCLNCKKKDCGQCLSSVSCSKTQGFIQKMSRELSIEQNVAGKKGSCQRCDNCRKEPCGQCTWCRSDEDRCFHKMCFEMPIDAKAEPAPGFPPGWRFYFAKNRRYQNKNRRPNSPYDYVPCLWILSPGGANFRSVEAAIRKNKFEDGEMIVHEFYEHVGLPHEAMRALANFRNEASRNFRTVGEKRFYGVAVDCISDEEKSVESMPRKKQRVKQSSTGQIGASTNHVLVGRNFCFKWTDLNKQSKVVYGKITECERNIHNGKIIGFKVTYARELLNKIGTVCGPKIQDVQMLDPLWAWSGCILAQQEVQDTSKRTSLGCPVPSFCFSWLTPALSIHSMVDSGGTQVPRLTIFHRCCQLQFDVKPSRIPNAGKGVFLSCTRCDGETGSFQLKAGELLDLGIYAPLRIQDCKLAAVFFVKNFIHNFKVEEFAYDAGDPRYHLDISDDSTGELHAAAKSQIFPFVNETFDERSVTVQCAFDPEGGIHYLLGHSNQEQGDFSVPTDGSEVELYINYGPEYEKVRIRKGYSKLSQEDQEGVLELQDAGYLESMDEFVESDIKACVDFLSMLFLTKSDFAPEVIHRALMCAVVLQRRARHFVLDNSSDSEVNMIKVSKKLHDLISVLLKNDELEELHSAGDCEEVLKRVFERHQFSNVALGELAFMLE